MARSKVEYYGAVLIDLTSDTVDAAHIMQGYTAHDASGEPIVGTVAVQAVLSGTSAPSASVGSDGDIYLVLSGGGSVEAYPEEITASSGMNSTSNATACIGKSASAGSSTSNVYSSGQSTTGVIEYGFDLSGVPADATVTSVACSVKAHEENASRSTMTLQLYAGSTAKGSKTTVNGTSNTVYDLTTGTWTRSELDTLVLHTEYGYYGGLVAGATLTVEYSAEQQASATLTVTEDGWTLGGEIWQKGGGAWSQVSTVALESAISRE